MLDFRLYAITDRHRCAPTGLADVVSALLDAGVTAFQLREKDLSGSALRKLAAPIAAMCRRYDAHLFINTALKVARDVGATGIHLPADASLTSQIASEFTIGCSVHSRAEAEKRAAAGADFLTFSPIYPTLSKPGYGPAVGPAGLAAVAEAVALPVFALGGIRTPAQVRECRRAGAFGVAVMSGLMVPTGARNDAECYLEAIR